MADIFAAFKKTFWELDKEERDVFCRNEYLKMLPSCIHIMNGFIRNNKLTKVEMAELLDVSPSIIPRLQSGERPLSIPATSRLCYVVGMSVQELFYERECSTEITPKIKMLVDCYNSLSIVSQRKIDELLTQERIVDPTLESKEYYEALPYRRLRDFCDSKGIALSSVVRIGCSAAFRPKYRRIISSRKATVSMDILMYCALLIDQPLDYLLAIDYSIGGLHYTDSKGKKVQLSAQDQHFVSNFLRADESDMIAGKLIAMSTI